MHGKSWDYESAFDRVRPDLVEALWMLLGVPAEIAGSVAAVWRAQRRYVELGPLVSQEPMWVDRSLPQGDPASSVGIATLLALPVRRIRAQVPRALSRVYAEDRTAVTETEAETRTVEAAWAALERYSAMRSKAGRLQAWTIDNSRQAQPCQRAVPAPNRLRRRQQ